MGHPVQCAGEPGHALLQPCLDRWPPSLEIGCEARPLGVVLRTHVYMRLAAHCGCGEPGGLRLDARSRPGVVEEQLVPAYCTASRVKPGGKGKRRAYSLLAHSTARRLAAVTGSRMGTYGDLWGPMGTYVDLQGPLQTVDNSWGPGCIRGPMGTFGFLWRAMGNFGGLWGCMGTYADFWGPMVRNGDIWGPMGAFGDPWRPMETHGELLAPYGCPWRPMGTDGCIWGPMWGFGVLWGTMGTFWGPQPRAGATGPRATCPRWGTSTASNRPSAEAPPNRPPPTGTPP